MGSGPKPQPQAEEEGEHRRQNGHIVQNKWRRNAYERTAQGYRMKYTANQAIRLLVVVVVVSGAGIGAYVCQSVLVSFLIGCMYAEACCNRTMNAAVGFMSSALTV